MAWPRRSCSRAWRVPPSWEAGWAPACHDHDNKNAHDDYDNKNDDDDDDDGNNDFLFVLGNCCGDPNRERKNAISLHLGSRAIRKPDTQDADSSLLATACLKLSCWPRL